MAVSVKLHPAFEAGIPAPLFEARVSGLTDVRTHYAVSADGQRFLINNPSEDRTPSPIAVVVNWSRRSDDDLGRTAGVDSVSTKGKT